MEILKSFILFGIVEVFIVLYFMKAVGKVDKIRYWHMLILCPLYLFCGYLNIPFSKQMGMLVITSVYFYIIAKDIKKGIVYSLIAMLYMLCIEMMVCSLLDVLRIVDLTKIDIYKKFLLMIPIRALEIIPLLACKNRRH